MIVGDIVMIAMARLNGKDVLLLLEDFDQLRQQRRGILRGKPCRRQRGLEPFGMVSTGWCFQPTPLKNMSSSVGMIIQYMEK